MDGVDEQHGRVHWRSVLGALEEWPLFASLQPMGPVFATVSRVEVPAPEWQAVIRHRGWDRRMVATFSSRDRAKRAVERWASAHWQAIEAALAAQDNLR